MDFFLQTHSTNATFNPRRCLTMKPMLAHKFSDHQSKVTYPVSIQPKLNGVRGLYNKGIFQSRDNHLYHPAVTAHLTALCHNLIPDNLILDGEFYLHGLSLQQINSAIAVNRNTPSPRTSSIQYHIFDCIDLDNLEATTVERQAILATLADKIAFRFGCNSNLQIVPTTLATQAVAETLYAYYRELGYEGIMYRSVNAPYGLEHNCGNKQNRWTYLLKRKEWIDDWFKAVGIEVTVGDKGFPGFRLHCLTPENKSFFPSSGLSQAEVEQFAENFPANFNAHIKYEMLSDDLIPLKSTVLEYKHD